MRIIRVQNPDELQKVAEIVLQHALADPEKKTLIEKLIADPEASRDALFATAFAMGVVQALSEMMRGNIVEIGSSEGLQSKS